ncbi:mycothiol transferase [Mariniluteicoccus flavus]
MFPAIHTESETYVGYISEMLDGIRNSAHGLTDDQARETPCRSTLSIGGIIKHCTWVMATQIGRRRSESGTAEGAKEFMSSFMAAPDETIDALLARFDETRIAYLQAIAGLDPDAEMTVAPKPWEDILEPTQASTRLLLAHHIDEFGRHAGHADIIREQVDGADAMGLRFAVEGRDGNAYITPWRPVGATSGA